MDGDWFDLQLFAEDSPTGQKTEPATPWRREEARRQGQVAKSADLAGTAVLAAGFAALYLSSHFMLERLEALFHRLPAEMTAGEIDLRRAAALAMAFVWDWLLISLPVLGAAFLAGYAGNVAQTGFLFTTEPLSFNLSRLNPVSGLGRIFSLGSVNELGKSLVKIALVGYLPYRFMVREGGTFLAMLDAPIGVALETSAWLGFRLAMEVILVLLLLAFVDYAFQVYQYEKSLMMSRYDIQQEMKQHDGDPHIKAAIRRRMAQMARRSVAKEVPKADVVITNPEHYAVALRYRQDEGDVAPTCLVKGTNAVALRIKEIAREHGIYIHENPPLARTLYAEVEPGEMIPEKLFVAVAEVLAHVYKERRRRV